MRRLLCLFLIGVAIAMPSVCLSSGIPDNSNGNGIPIYGGGGTGEGDDPNGVHPIPITCSYSETLNDLVFYFSDDIGVVNITIVNITSWENYFQAVDSQLGLVNIPISGNEGYYYISIATPSGGYYYGQFSI